MSTVSSKHKKTIKRLNNKNQKTEQIRLEFYNPRECNKVCHLRKEYGKNSILASISYYSDIPEYFLIDKFMNEVIFGSSFKILKKEDQNSFFSLLSRKVVLVALGVSTKIKDFLKVNQHDSVELNLIEKITKQSLHNLDEFNLVEKLWRQLKNKIRLKCKRLREWSRLLTQILGVMNEKKLKDICVRCA